MLLPLKVSVQRLTAGLNPKQESYVTILTGVRMDIQPARPDLTAVAEGVYGNTFSAFTTVSGIKLGDQVTVSGTGDLYIVRGVNNWKGIIPHAEYILFKGDQ